MSIRIHIGSSSPVDMEAERAEDALKKHTSTDKQLAFSVVKINEEDGSIQFETFDGKKTILKTSFEGFEIHLC